MRKKKKAEADDTLISLYVKSIFGFSLANTRLCVVLIMIHIGTKSHKVINFVLIPLFFCF